MGIPNVTVSFLPVLIAAVASMAVGMVWYSPAVFGRSWMKLSGLTPTKLNKAKKEGMGKSYLAAFIGALVTSYVLALFAKYTTASTLVDALQLGFWIWLGFVAPIMLGIVLWEGKSARLYFINIFHYLVSLVVMSLILVSWQ